MHYRAEMDFPSEPTDAMNFGSAYHAAVLEPNTFEDEYAGLAEKVDRRTKAGKLAWSEFEEANAGKTLLVPGEMPKILAMRDRVWERPDCRRLLGDGNNRSLKECAVIWDDETTGTRCKALVDAITPEGYKTWTVVVDLKTCQDASFSGFRDSVARYDYDYQLAFYLDGLHALAPVGRLAVILAQEKTYPFAPALHEITEEDLDAGRRRYQDDLMRLATCTQRDEWPGYPQGPKPCPVKPWKRQDRELREVLYAGE
jgi:exodeoxyribonuclease VIII